MPRFPTVLALALVAGCSLLIPEGEPLDPDASADADVDVDSDVDGDTDTDTDSDADSDVDTDADVDGDSDGCVPDCEGRECGPDLCGGQCGECLPGWECTEAGGCFCVGGCGDRECGTDACGVPCPPGCSGATICVAGRCEAPACALNERAGHACNVETCHDASVCYNEGVGSPEGVCSQTCNWTPRRTRTSMPLKSSCRCLLD